MTSRARRWGPFALLCAAVPLILADIVRHVAQDLDWWPGCGNNPTFSRANSSDPFPSSCFWSSSEYHCLSVCCVPTWLPLPPPANRTAAANGSREYGWFPPQSELFPEGGPDASGGQFGTLRPDGSLYLPPEFERARLRGLGLLAYSPPFALRDDGSLFARGSNEPACAFGVNEQTGACFLVDPELPFDEQLRALPRKDPALPYDRAANPADCSCDYCTEYEDMRHLSPMGILFTIVATYSGFAALACAVLWNANIGAQVRKVRAEWRALLAARAQGRT